VWAHRALNGHVRRFPPGQILDGIFAAAVAQFPAPGDTLRFILPKGTAEAGMKLEIHRPDDARDPFVDVPHHPLFATLSVPGIMAVFSALRPGPFGAFKRSQRSSQ